MTIKLQCPCGTKYELDILPEHIKNPIPLICQHCGQDSSSLLDQIVRQHFAQATPPPQPRVRINLNQPVQAPVEPSRPARLQVAQPVAAAAAPEATEAAAEPVATTCFRHKSEAATSHCVVCQKPICPLCMQMFGHLCSAYCKAQAESQGIEVPACEFEKFTVEARFWKKVRRVAALIVLFVAALVGLAVWYEFSGSRPKEVFSVKFPEENSDGFCRIVAKDQVLVRHGNQLTRYDVNKKAEVWTASLFDAKQIEDAAKEWVDQRRKEQERWRLQRARLKAAGKLDRDDMMDLMDDDEPQPAAEQLKRAKELVLSSRLEGLQFHFEGTNIWIIFTNKVARFDWQTGKADKEIKISGGVEEFLPQERSLLVLSAKDPGTRLLTHIQLPDAEVKSEEIVDPTAKLASAPAKKSGTNVLARASTTTKGVTNAALIAVAQVKPGTKVAQIPAPTPRAMTVHANPDYSGDELMQKTLTYATGTNLVNAGENAAEIRVELIEEKFVQVRTMKDKPKQSALDGNVNSSSTLAVANEFFNEWKEQETGGVRLQDESRYNVTIHRYLQKEAADWNAEVTGPPHFFPLQTVDLLVAGKSLVAMDKANHKRWDSKLNFIISEESLLERERWNSEGEERFMPCVERQAVVYFFDPGVLTAFDAANGNVRWRLPSVGVSHVQFDHEGLMYVVTTSADPEQIKYSEQIDISRKTLPVLLKVDPKNGKILWKLTRMGESCILSGKFLYSVEATYGDPDPLKLNLGAPEHTRIYRLNPKDGSTEWEFYMKKFAVDVAFRENTIQLLFPNEMKVLRFCRFDALPSSD
jgi:hypothetical protein